MSERLTTREEEIVRPFVTNADRPVFLLRNLPEEVVAVLFAYYSRSREPLRHNLLKLIQENDLDFHNSALLGEEGGEALASAREKARQFHEKWVVGYGHASVAEHAVAHIAVEDVSILASKVIEDARLASYTEKSTRYVIFEKGRYLRLPEMGPVYEETCAHLFETYSALMPRMVEAVRSALPRKEGQSERDYDAACRAKACDALRYLLPAATLTNIGITLNARALEHLLTKMLSHPLEEVRVIAAAMKEEAVKQIPTLLKYADYNPYMAETGRAMEALAKELPAPSASAERPVALVYAPEDAEDRLAAAILYGYTRHSWEALVSAVKSMSSEQKERVLDEYLSRRGRFDAPLRALEHLYYTFEILVDYGAFRDIQRHRMATQTAQENTPIHGYCIPQEISDFGFEAEYKEAMDRSASAWETLARSHPAGAGYMLPLAYRKRVLFTWNLRELHHFIQLRSSRQGHISYRRIAQAVYEELSRVHPLLARYVRVDMSDYELGRL
ncbi:MAG: FAD-dependent thymidylate synthase [Armatimonadetes bacterium]|nr:FAD-dependent thymidylate synthase [Armatimonadota bacterium]